MVVADLRPQHPARQVQQLWMADEALQIGVELGGKTLGGMVLVLARHGLDARQGRGQVGASRVGQDAGQGEVSVAVEDGPFVVTEGEGVKQRIPLPG